MVSIPHRIHYISVPQSHPASRLWALELGTPHLELLRHEIAIALGMEAGARAWSSRTDPGAIVGIACDRFLASPAILPVGQRQFQLGLHWVLGSGLVVDHVWCLRGARAVYPAGQQHQDRDSWPTDTIPLTWTGKGFMP